MGTEADQEPGGTEDPAAGATEWYLSVAFTTMDQLREDLDHQRSRAGQIAALSGGLIALLAANADDILGAIGDEGPWREICGAFLLAGLLSLVVAITTALRFGVRIRRRPLALTLGGQPARPRLNPSALELFTSDERFSGPEGFRRAQSAMLGALTRQLQKAHDRTEAIEPSLRRAIVAIALGLAATLVVGGILVVEVIS